MSAASHGCLHHYGHVIKAEECIGGLEGSMASVSILGWLALVDGNDLLHFSGHVME